MDGEVHHPDPRRAADAASVMVLVPGMGHPDHARLMRRGMAWLRRQAQQVTIECLISVYRPLDLGGTDFSPCELIHEQRPWAEVVKLLPERRWKRHDAILIWDADVVPGEEVDLREMTTIMALHRLDHACLSFHPSRPKAPFKVMQARPGGGVGRLTNFCEIGLFGMYRPWAFGCLQGLIVPGLNQNGWGADLVFHGACSRRRPAAAVRIAVLDAMTMVDTSTGSYDKGSAWDRMVDYLTMHVEDSPVLDPVAHREIAPHFNSTARWIRNLRVLPERQKLAWRHFRASSASSPPDSRSCLADSGPRPAGRVHGRHTSLEIGRLDDLRPILASDAAHKLRLMSSFGQAPERECAREVPKKLHFIWLNSPLREAHAANILGFAQKNLHWLVFLWVDRPISNASARVLSGAERRPAGGVAVRDVVRERRHFRNWDLIAKHPNMAGRSDFLRHEVVYSHGGIYLDTDSVALHGFDDYGALFRWPFVTYTIGTTLRDATYNDLCNCAFGAEPGSGFLHFTLSSMRESCLVHGQCGVDGAGPPSFTAMFLRYDQPEISMISSDYLLFAKDGTHQNIMYQNFEANWLFDMTAWYLGAPA